MLNVVTLKTGTAYGAEYPNRMRSMLARHLKLPHLFHCLTDDPRGVKALNVTIPLHFQLPGWWGKLFLFSSLMPPGPLLYLDLDQLILGDITDIVQECLQRPFACYSDHIEWCGVKLGTAFMTLEAHSFSHIFDEFYSDHARIMHEYEHGGDQVYLGGKIPPESIWYFNDHFPPGTVQSYKFDYLENGLSPNCKILNFHGRPKPHELNSPELMEHWQ